MTDPLTHLKSIVEFVSFFTEDAIKKPFIKEELLTRLRELERSLRQQVLKPLTPQQIEDALNEGRAESMAARGDNAWTSLLRQRDEAQAELVQDREIFSKVNEAINRAGVHCAVYFWEAIDRVAQERDEARTEVAQMRPVYLAAMHWSLAVEAEAVDLATMRLERVCREAKAKEPSHDE